MHVKKYTQKDRHGNMMSFEFEIPQMNIPAMENIPHPGGPKGTDTVPAWLTPGEFVVNKEATQMYGNVIEDMNDQGREIQAMKGMEVPEYAQAGKQIPGPYDWITPNLIDAIKQTESGGRHTDAKGNLIKSSAGALGAYQWKPDSAAQPGFGVEPFDVTDEAAQRKATEQYLIGIQKENPNFTQEQVIQSYNAGPERMKQYVANMNVPDQISGQKPLTKETQEYDDKVLKAAGLKEWGVTPKFVSGNVPSSNAVPIVVPGFEGQDPNKMSPIRLKAYNEALAKMQNNNMPIETEITENRKNIDYGDPSLKVPELDGIAEDPSDSTTIDYTKDVPNLEKVLPGFVDKTFPNRGRGKAPTKTDDAKRVAAIKYGADVKTDFKGRPEKVNPNRLDPKVIENAAKANVEGNLSDAGYEKIKADFEQAKNQDAAAKAYEVEVTQGKKVSSEDALANTIDGLTKQLGTDEVKNNIIMNKIEEIEKNNFNKQNNITSSDSKDNKVVQSEKKKSEVLTAIINDANKTNDTKVNTHTEDNTKTAVTGAGNQGKQNVKKAESFLSELFGDLIDKKELGRMAVMYAGSRLLGGSHIGSLGWAAKNYIKRIDTKAANINKTAATLLSKGKHTTASIAAYKKSGNMGDLVLIGTPINSTGEDKYFFHPKLKKKVLAYKYKQGDNVFWSVDGGKSKIPTTWTTDGTAVRGSKDYQSYVTKTVPMLTNILKDDKKTYDTKKETRSSDGKVTKTTYHTAINITNAASAASKWAADNNIPADELGPIVSRAYRMAVNQAGGEKETKPTSLLPYLNALKIRADTGVPGLFTQGTGAEIKNMDAAKVNGLTNMWLAKVNRAGQSVNDGDNRDQANIFWRKASLIWADKLRKDPKLIERYQSRAQKDETPFYVFAKEQLSLPI